jgi:FkbM family methyltransferase
MRNIFLLIVLSYWYINANIPPIIQSKADTLRIYHDSKETEKLGYGDWDPYIDGEFLVIKQCIQEGDMVIDAGAHFGDWSRLVLEHTHKNCTLYSFEPVPYFFSILTKTVGSRAHCYNCALGEREKEAVMNYYYEESEGCSSLYERTVLSDIPVKKIVVPVISLDIFCKQQGIEAIDFLKIDVEGAEWDVLQGAHGLISQKKIRFIQFEYGGTYPDAAITLEQVYAYLTEQGYVIFRITADGLVYIPMWRNALENYHLSNYLAVRCE